MQPAPEKPPQAKVLCMGTKRILDDTELSNDISMQGSDPTGMYDVQVSSLSCFIMGATHFIHLIHLEIDNSTEVRLLMRVFGPLYSTNILQ